MAKQRKPSKPKRKVAKKKPSSKRKGKPYKMKGSLTAKKKKKKYNATLKVGGTFDQVIDVLLGGGVVKKKK